MNNIQSGRALFILTCLLVSTFFVGCRTSPPTSVPPPDPKSKQQVFNHPLADTRKAALDALLEIGCSISREEPNFIEGVRPMISGLVMTSGGEVVRVWFESGASGETTVKVFTVVRKVARSTLGVGLATALANRAGMKYWEDDVLSSMAQSLK